MNWERNGAEIRNFINPETGKAYSRPQNTDYYFRRGVTYPMINSGSFSARFMPNGFIFGHAGNSFLIDDNSMLRVILGFLNTSFLNSMIKLLNPTINVLIDDLLRIPFSGRLIEESNLSQFVTQAIVLAKVDSEEDETTWDFVAPPDWPDGTRKAAERHVQLAEIERQIDEEVYRLYGISDEDRQAIEAELATGSIPQLDDDLEETEPEDSAEQEPSESTWSSRLLPRPGSATPWAS